MTPEQAQKLSDLRVRMLENIRNGKSSIEGIGQEDIRDALSCLRQNRAASAAAGGKKKAAKEKSSKPKVEIDLSGFTDMNLD